MTLAWLVASTLASAAAPLIGPSVLPVEVPHASGGIGDDDPLATMSGDYNLQIVFATQGSGEYLADIAVQITDAKGRMLLEAESPGPLFYVRLPAGSYRVSASFHGMALQKSFAVSDRGLQNLYFYWPREAIETDNGRR